MAVTGNEVKIGIDAPKNISVNRVEIYLRIQAEKNTQTKFKITEPISYPGSESKMYEHEGLKRAKIEAEFKLK